MVYEAILLGELVEKGKLIDDENSKQTSITIAVKNPKDKVENNNEMDLVDCILHKEKATNIIKQYKKGDIVIARGLLSTDGLSVSKSNNKLLYVDKIKLLSLESKIDNERWGIK